MNPVELQLPDGKPSGVWMCQTCRHLHNDHIYSGGEGCGLMMATRCCEPVICEYCKLPVDVSEKPWTAHRECRDFESAHREAERLEKAEKVTDYDGWLYLEGPEEFFRDMDAVLDHLECDDDGEPREDWPEYAYCCKEQPFEGPDPYDIYESLTEELYGDASEDLQGCAEFEAACKAFTEANAGMVTYYPDYTRAVKIPPREEMA